MKVRPNTDSIAIYFLFTLIWFTLHTSTSELKETNIIPLLEHNKIPQHHDEDRTNALTLYNAINNNNYVSAIFFPFLTMQDILILRGTCKDFQILLQPNKQNDMVIFCKNFSSKDIYEAPLKWVDLKYLLDQSYVTAFSKIEMFNIKTNKYALLIHYIVPICHKNIISWHNEDINYPQILVDRATNAIFENEQSDDKLLLPVPHYDYPLIFYTKYGDAWAKITKERNVVTGGDIVYEGDPTQLKNVKKIVSSGSAFTALLDDGHVVAWGKKDYGGLISDEIQLKLQNVKMIFSNYFAFVALLDNGNVVAWGYENFGGIIPDETQRKLQNVKLIFSSNDAFAALLDDGHVVAWGRGTDGVIPDKIQTQLQNVKMMFSNNGAFTALLDDGHVVAWGHGYFGGVIPDKIQSQLQNVKMIFSNNEAFTALLDDGSAFAWGSKYYGGKISDQLQQKLMNNVKTIFPGKRGGFTAFCNDGEIIKLK